jgi:hypothetical protein
MIQILDIRKKGRAKDRAKLDGELLYNSITLKTYLLNI